MAQILVGSHLQSTSTPYAHAGPQVQDVTLVRALCSATDRPFYDIGCQAVQSVDSDFCLMLESFSQLINKVVSEAEQEVWSVVFNNVAFIGYGALLTRHVLFWASRIGGLPLLSVCFESCKTFP